MGDTRIGNYQACCRLCLSEKQETLKSVFDESAGNQGLSQKISTFVAVEITPGDKMTTMVCEHCVVTINSWQNFKQACSRNQSKLEQWLNMQWQPTDMAEMSFQIKMEPIEDHDHGVEIVEIGQNHYAEQNENRIKLEPMEEVYNELPPSLSPQSANMSQLESEESQNSMSDVMSARECRYCHKTFSNTGNRIRHERLLHLSKKNTPSKASTTSDDISQSSSQTPIQDIRPPVQIEVVPRVSEAEQNKILFAAGLKLLQKDSTPISMEQLSKIELSYIEKCKAMVSMYRTLICACHNVNHPNVKGLLSHLRALRIWFPVFTCYNCMITFTDRPSFTRHNVGCKKQSLETITKLSNLRKRSMVKRRLYQNYKCTSCRFMYSFHEDFCKHVNEEHVGGHAPYKCSCSLVFNDQDEYKDHIYVSCMVEYYCDICFITVRTLDAFQNHAKEVHDNSEGFILLQDDDYKLRKSLTVAKEKVEKEKEDVIVSGKRRSSFYNKAPILEPDDDYEPKKKAKKSSLPYMHPERPGQCPLCDKEYSSYHNMLRHYKTHPEVCGNIPQDDSLYSCPDCGGMFNSEEWQIHLQENHEAKYCGECGKIFQFQTELDQHRSVHLNLKICRDSKTKSYKSTMLSPNSNGSSEVELMCELCETMFASKEELIQHRMMTHDVKQEPMESNSNSSIPEEIVKPKFSCHECDKHYTGYNGLWDHNKRKHPDRKIPLSTYPKKCKYCDKICATGGAYQIHKQMHERMNHMASDIQTNNDQINGEGSKQPIRIKKQNKSDDEEESYHTCKRCFKVFSSKYNLKNHMKSHGIIPQTKPGKSHKKVFCDVCHMSFDSNETLHNHKEEEHSGDEMPELQSELEDSDNKVPIIFTCDVCVMVFTSKIALKKHKETHEQEEKPLLLKGEVAAVFCRYCRIPFESVGQLSNHMRVEHEDGKGKTKLKELKGKPFQCGVCRKSFATALALNAHAGWHKRGVSFNETSKTAKFNKSTKAVNKIATALAKPPQVPVKPPEFQCTTCLAELPNDTALQIHILEKHRNIDAIMLVPRCNTCNQDFNTQDEYETHKRLHDLLERQKIHDSRLVPNPVAIKAKVATPPQKLIVKNYHCKQCPAAFTRQDTYMAHMRQNHNTQNEYRCNQCDRVFEKQNALSIHLKVHEKQKMLGKAAKPAGTKPLFSCSICNMGFDLPKDLRTHTINAHPF